MDIITTRQWTVDGWIKESWKSKLVSYADRLIIKNHPTEMKRLTVQSKYTSGQVVLKNSNRSFFKMIKYLQSFIRIVDHLTAKAPTKQRKSAIKRDLKMMS